MDLFSLLTKQIFRQIFHFPESTLAAFTQDCMFFIKVKMKTNDRLNKNVVRKLSSVWL